MAKLRVFVCFILFGLTLGIPFSKPNSRIVGGLTARKGQFPYQVSIQDHMSGHFCGGSIVNEKWILTAAHCDRGISPKILVVVGVVNWSNLESTGRKHSISEVIVHPEYNFNGRFANDLALVKLENSIVFSDYVKSIDLSESNMDTAGLPVIASGWGRLSLGGVRPKELQFLHSVIYDHDSCVKRMAEIPGFPAIRKEHVCVFSQKGEGLCHGDSGGPIVSGNTLVGVISLAEPCAKGYPDIGIQVWSHLDWIKNNTLLQ